LLENRLDTREEAHMRLTQQTATELKQTVLQAMAQLETLRDELRVELHLAGMDVKDQWRKWETLGAVKRLRASLR
jgi:hypothetical protein